MDTTCLLVDVDESGLVDDWQARLADSDFPLSVCYSALDGVVPMLETGTVVMMVVFCQDSSQSKSVCQVLEEFRDRVGPLPHFQGIVCSDPSPFFITDVFEYGIEDFIAAEDWEGQVAAKARSVVEILGSADASETKIINLSRSIQKGDRGGIVEAEAGLGDAHEYDYLAAYSKASALQAVGKFNEAAVAFRNSGNMNKHFRPADTKLGENLLVIGKVDDAIRVYERLDRSNPRNVERKAALATAYMEKGDIEKAKELFKQAKKLDPDHSCINEAHALMLLSAGKLGAAFKMMDQLSGVGPFFASKLNEMGIKLSQQGKGKNALALYQKAHKVVKKELKYKVSLNAALACYRLKDYEMALKYLARVEKEYGRGLEKVEKIRRACKSSLTKKAG